MSDLSPETSEEQQYPTQALKELKRWSHHFPQEADLFLTAKVQKKKPKVAEGKEEISCSLYTLPRSKYQLCCADLRCQI